MTPVRSFAGLRARATGYGPVRIAVAGGDAPEIIAAIAALMRGGLVSEAAVTGDAGAIGAALPAGLPGLVRLCPASDPAACARAAVAEVAEGRADILMKGHVDSTAYLRAVVDRETGLRAGPVLSNVTVAAMPTLPRLIAATDNGILPAPDLAQKRQIIQNTAPLFRGLGISPVRVAAVCATEKVSDTMPATRDAAALARDSATGALPGFEIGGPMGYDVAVSPEAATTKKLAEMPAAGAADLLLFPAIDAANAVVKSWKYHGQADTGSVVLGAKVPVLLNSRSDSAQRRVNALLLATAVLMGGGRG